MSATIYSVSVTFTVYDSDHLPEGVYPDDVRDELKNLVSDTVNGWYEEAGDNVLACEPDVV